MTETTWRQHPTHTNYEVSTDGRIRSVDRYVRHYRGGQQFVAGRELKLSVKANGYLGGIACSEGKRAHVWAHTMVLETHVGSRPDGFQVRHLNGNPLDNRLENLAWGSVAENAQDRERHGRNPLSQKTHCKRDHEFTEANTIRRVTKEGWNLRSCRECARMHDRSRAPRGKKRDRSLPSNVGE